MGTIKTAKIMGVYSISNLVNNKRYIGQSIDIKNRYNYHKYRLSKNKHPNKYLQYSWNKYGEGNFKFEVLEIMENTTKELLTEREEYWFQWYKENGGVYNLRDSVCSNANYKHSEETKEKLRKNMLGRNYTEEHKKHISESKKGWKPSQETIEKFKNRIFTDETKEKLSIAGKNRKHTEETKEKISKANKGKPKSEEHKIKLSISEKGKIISEESKKKMSESRKGRISPKGMLGKNHTEETKKKMSEAWNRRRGI